MLTDVGQINKPINRPQQMIRWNVVVYRELIKQCALRFLLWSQHRDPLTSIRELNQRKGLKSRRVFQRNTPKIPNAMLQPNGCSGLIAAISSNLYEGLVWTGRAGWITQA